MPQCVQTGVLKDTELDKRAGVLASGWSALGGGLCCLVALLGWHLVLHRVWGPGLWGGSAPAVSSPPSLPPLPLLQTQPESSTCPL